MAKPTAKNWYDSFDWTARDNKDTITIFGHHFPNVEAIQTTRDITTDTVVIRWRNRADDQIHEFKIEPDWTCDDPTTQIQAMLVSIKMS